MKDVTAEEMETVVSQALEEAVILSNELMGVINPLLKSEKMTTISLSLMMILVGMRRTLMPDTTMEELLQVMRSLDESTPQMKWIHTSHLSDAEH
jgi:hypothetical protein